LRGGGGIFSKEEKKNLSEEDARGGSMEEKKKSRQGFDHTVIFEEGRDYWKEGKRSSHLKKD